MDYSSLFVWMDLKEEVRLLLSLPQIDQIYLTLH